MLPIKHNKEPLGKGLKAHPTAFSMQHLGEFNQTIKGGGSLIPPPFPTSNPFQEMELQ
jgi:hypothetical protein